MLFRSEIPLLVVLLTAALKAGGAGASEFSLAQVVSYQQANGSFGLNITMIPALLSFLCFIPGTMGCVPFDLPEAEPELLEGPLLEYSGSLLAMFNIMSALKLVIVTGLGVVLFFPGTVAGGALVNLGWFVFKCLMFMLVAVTLVRTATGRLRTDQTFKFYLKYPSVLAYVSLGLTLLLK